jgi:hypothetical protein
MLLLKVQLLGLPQAALLVELVPALLLQLQQVVLLRSLLSVVWWLWALRLPQQYRVAAALLALLALLINLV